MTGLSQIKTRLVTIGEIFKISSGGTPSRKKDDYFCNGNIAWIKTGDLKGKFVNSATEYISQLGLDNSSAKLFPPKTVLLAMYGATIGACSILPFEAATNQACAAILPSDDCDESFLYYYLTSIKTTLVNKGVGGAQPNISAGLIKKLKIPLPPLAEQQKIASVLDAADSLRHKDQQLIAKYNDISQSLFLEMFGDPVTNPMGWDVLILVDMIEFLTSGSRGWAKYYSEIGDLFLRIQNIGKNRLLLNDVTFVTPPVSAEAKRTKVEAGDILLSITADLGRTAVIPVGFPLAYINQHLAIIRLKSKYLPFYVGILHIPLKVVYTFEYLLKMKDKM